MEEYGVLGLLFTDTVIYNYVKNPKENFINIINNLKEHKIYFIAEIISSCQFEEISEIYDFSIDVKNLKVDRDNLNTIKFLDLLGKMFEINTYFYVFDVYKNILYVKKPGENLEIINI